MKTSSFSYIRKHPEFKKNVVSISTSKPGDFSLAPECFELSPGWKILRPYHDGKIDEEMYIKLYREKLEKFDAKKIYNELLGLTGGEEPILLCWCKKNDFCHRHLAADWLSENLDIEIKELGHPELIRKSGYLVKSEEQMELF